MDGRKQGYTTKELAEMAGVDPSRIRQLLIEGTLKGQKFGRDWYVPKEEARRWLDSRQ